MKKYLVNVISNILLGWFSIPMIIAGVVTYTSGFAQHTTNAEMFRGYMIIVIMFLIVYLVNSVIYRKLGSKLNAKVKWFTTTVITYIMSIVLTSMILFTITMIQGLTM